MFSRFLVFACLLAASLGAGASLLPDGNFDANPNSVWSTFGANAYPDEGAPGVDGGVEGTESLKMFGNFTESPNFTGAYQDIAVDGVNLAVGNLVSLSGVYMHRGTDALANSRVSAFLELTFVDSSFTEFGFGLNQSAALLSTSNTDEWIAASTGFTTVPTNAAFVRAKAIFFQNDEPTVSTGGAAWFDQLSLVAVPEASETAIVALGMAGLLTGRRRKRRRA